MGGGVEKEGRPVWYCCNPALAVLESVEDADWRRLPPLGDGEDEGDRSAQGGTVLLQECVLAATCSAAEGGRVRLAS